MFRCLSGVLLVTAAGSPAFARIDIDYAFISELEGGQQLKGYVPDPEGSMSGVTIATGVDLGGQTEAGLKALGLKDSLIAKLKPYLGLKKKAAVDKLKATPLTIEKPEADELDAAVKKGATATIVAAYNKAVKDKPGLKKFEDLPAQAQTVIASVAYQYGDLASRTPTFWKHVTAQDWMAAVKELYNFGDKDESRRFGEGDRLAQVVKNFPTVGDSVGKNGKNAEADVKVVQQLLKDKGVYAGQVTGKVDEATIKAIEKFQKEIKGTVDGRVDPPDAKTRPVRKMFRRLVGKQG